MKVEVKATGNKLLKAIGLFSGSIHAGITDRNVNGIYILEQSNQNATGNNHLITSNHLKTETEMKKKETFQEFNFEGIWTIKIGDFPEFIKADDLTITIDNQKRDYYIGEKIETYYTKLNVNGTQVSLTEDMLKPYDTSKQGLQIINGEYRNQNFSFEINIKMPTTVTDLKIEKAPKLTYTENEKFDPSGLVLIATIDGKSYRRIYSGYTYDKTNPLKIEDKVITFTYANETVTANLTVTSKQAKEVIVLKAPTKSDYYEGEKLNLEGLLLQITYTDGTKSPSFDVTKLAEYNVNLAKQKENQLIAIHQNEVISIEDNNRNIFAFVGKIEEYNVANKRIATLKVTREMTFANQNIIVTQNRDNLECTDNIIGGSGNYQVRLKSGTLPQNINVTFTGINFRIEGRPTQIQDQKLIYEIKDLQTGQIIEIEIKISVQKVSTEAKFYTFQLLKTWNPSLKNDINGIIQENEVLLYVPQGTNLTNLIINHTESRGATLPMKHWNGSAIDFTNPVKFTITAQDGITTKDYMVKVITNQTANTYVGDLNTELYQFKKGESDGASFVSGEIVVVEWVNGQSTVPTKTPKMRFVSTDGVVDMEVFVTPTGTNTYYFDRYIEGINTTKEYKFIVESTDPNNVSQYNKVPVYFKGKFANKEIGKYHDYKIKLKDNKIIFADSTYIGNLNTELYQFNKGESDGVSYISGEIVVVEWVDGQSTVPTKKPKMRFVSTDGVVNMEVFVKATGTNTYYFDRYIEGIDTTRQYQFIVESTDTNNISQYNKVPVYFKGKFANKVVGRYKDTQITLERNKIVFK